MNDPMRILKFDHRDVKELLTKLAETDEGRERDALVIEVTTKLSAHMEMEEQILYPVVAQEVGAEDEEEAEIEHGLAREGLEKINSMKALPGFGAVVEMLKAGIEHHVKEEETELLPELKTALDRSAWLALGDRLAEAKRAAGMELPPEPKRRSHKRATSAKASKAKSGSNGRN